MPLGYKSMLRKLWFYKYSKPHRGTSRINNSKFKIIALSKALQAQRDDKEDNGNTDDDSAKQTTQFLIKRRLWQKYSSRKKTFFCVLTSADNTKEPVDVMTKRTKLSPRHKQWLSSPLGKILTFVIGCGSNWPDVCK